jgi:hypothetical protein
MGFITFSVQTGIIFLNIINKLIYVMRSLMFSLGYELKSWILFRPATISEGWKNNNEEIVK